MKHHKNLNIIDYFNITGRGTVYVYEFNENDPNVYTNDTFEYKSKNYQIISIEGFRNVNGFSKELGLIAKELK